MRVLVTGGAGYIGSAILNLLLRNQESYVIDVLDRFDQGTNSLNSFLMHPSLRLVKGDIRDKGLVADCIKTADVVIHLAAVVGFPACDRNPYEAKSINIDGTQILCDLLGKNQRLIFASTGSTYGKIQGVCDEQSPINPLTLYGRTKAEGEKMVLDSNGICLRLATLFGVSGTTRNDLLINNLMRDAVKNRCITVFQGSARRTFLDVAEAARCFKMAIDGLISGDGAEVYNVGDEALNYSKSEIAKKISELTGAFLFERNYSSDPDERDYQVCYAKIRDSGFTNQIDILTTLKTLKIYYEVN